MQTLPALSSAQVGDTIVTLVGSPRDGGFASAVEELALGFREGSPAYLFASIADIAVGHDGSMLILELPFRGRASLRLYDAEGRFVRAVGRVGDGPGEYRTPVAIAVMQDGRFLLLDRLNRRLTVYESSGDFAETWPIPHYNVTSGQRNAMTVDSASIIALRFTQPAQGDFLEADPAQAVVRIRVGGVVIDTLAEPRLPDLDVAITKIAQRGGFTAIGRLRVPYAPRAFWQFSPLGYFVTGVSSRYAIDLRLPGRHDGDDASPAIWREGDPILSIRLDVPPVEVASAERRDQKAHMEDVLRAMEGGTQRGRLMDTPRLKPFYQRIHVADDGRIWVRIHTKSERYAPPERRTSQGEQVPQLGWRERTMMDVFEPDGTYVGRVQLPDDLRLIRFRGDRIWAVARDEFDVEYVKRYRVSWDRQDSP
jgi:hypothetical protein